MADAIVVLESVKKIARKFASKRHDTLYDSGWLGTPEQ